MSVPVSIGPRESEKARVRKRERRTRAIKGTAHHVRLRQRNINELPREADSNAPLG